MEGFKEFKKKICLNLVRLMNALLLLLIQVAEFLVGPGAFPWDFPGNQIDEPLLDEDEDSDDSSDFGDVMHPLQAGLPQLYFRSPKIALGKAHNMGRLIV